MARPRKSEFRVLGPYFSNNNNRYRIILVDPDGVRITQWFDDERTALREKAKLVQKLGGNVLISEALYRWIEVQRARGLRARTLGSYEERVRLFIGADYLQALTLDGFTEKLATERFKRLSEHSADTQHNYLKETKNFFRWCVEEKLLSQSPVEKIKFIGKLKKGRPQLTLDESKAFVQGAYELHHETEDYLPIGCLVALSMGLRNSEIRNIKVRDIDADGAILWIWDAKTDAGRRCVRVSEVVRPALRALRARNPEERPFDCSSGRLIRTVKNICERQGLRKVTPHGLRATKSSLERLAGTPLDQVARMLGQSGTRITSDHYVSPAAENQARQTQVDALFTPRSSSSSSSSSDQPPPPQVWN